MSVTNRSLESPDETRTFDHGQVQVVKIGDTTIGRYSFEPGWRWSESVKPIAKTDSCQAHHVGYILSGRLHVKTDDGGEAAGTFDWEFPVRPEDDVRSKLASMSVRPDEVAHVAHSHLHYDHAGASRSFRRRRSTSSGRSSHSPSRRPCTSGASTGGQTS